MASFALAIYIVLILVRPMDWWEPLLGWQLVTAGAIVVFFLGSQKVLNRFQTTWKDIPQIKLAVAFWIAAILSWGTQFWFGGMVTAFQELGKVLFFFVLILLLVRTNRDFSFLIWALLLSVLWLAVHAILQHHRGYGFGGYPPLERIRNRETGEIVRQARAFGVFNDPNDLCLILVVAIPCFYVLYKTYHNPIGRAFCLAGGAVSAYGAWCTNSRGGVVALFGMVVSYVIVSTKGLRRYLVATTAISLVTVLAPSRFGGGMSGSARSIQWGDGLAMFKAHPLFGVGYGDFTSYSSEHMVAHNTYIHVLAELGLVGYLPFFLIIYLTLLYLRRTINLGPLLAPNVRLVLIGIFSALTGYFTGMYFVSRQFQHILYVLFGIAITAVYSACKSAGVYQTVFGNLKTDLRNGLLWGLGSVGIIWISIRAATMLS